jgi:hypothetical protein
MKRGEQQVSEGVLVAVTDRFEQSGVQRLVVVGQRCGKFVQGGREALRLSRPRLE